MATKSEIDQFLKDVQLKSFKKTSYIVKNDDDALDIVQNAMINLIKSYHQKDIKEIKLLFPTILYNETMTFLSEKKQINDNTIAQEDILSSVDSEDMDSIISSLSTDYKNNSSPESLIAQKEIIENIEKAMKDLPHRQTQAVYLRHIEGFSVEECAQIMGCTTGSVKTHTSRAIEYILKKISN